MVEYKQWNSTFLWVSPALHFLVELTAWIATLFTSYWVLTLVDAAALGIFNAEGDKRPPGDGPGIIVPGFVRLIIEWLTGALSLWSISYIFGRTGLVFQSSIIILWIWLQIPRWLWMVGISNEPPMFVKYVRSFNSSKRSA